MRWVFLAVPLVMVASADVASAVTMQECSAKYSAAKSANTLGGKSWADFRKSDCGQAVEEPKSAIARAAAPTPPNPALTTTNAKFPSAVDSKYAKETPSRARMKTCVDQYNANKTANANGGLKWIEKGGGYYSACSKKLKGA